MNREIKFRAWDGNTMQTNFLLLSCDGTVHAKEGNGPLLQRDWIIMQYTGLKDKNGKEIFAGDIVWDEEWGYDPKTGKKDVGQFCWDEDGRWVLVGGKKSEYALGGYVYHPFKVIGNIHENPELLSDKAGEGV